MLDRKIFFDGIRQGPFPGRLTREQVQGVSAILDEWKRRDLTDQRWLAYMLATAFHETAATMQPIYERGQRSYFNKYEPGTKIGKRLGNKQKGDGYLYRGRGLVQLTGRANYKKMGGLLYVDLERDPDKALKPTIAVAIMFEGMLRADSFRGDFTGKALEDYFNEDKTDWINARRIINGVDRAQDIAGIAKQFYADLVAAS